MSHLGQYTPCAVLDCDRPTKAYGLCPRHARTCRTYFETDTLYFVQWLCTRPACEACGASDNLRVDHQHGHCATGCKGCVRGRLCHGCNVAEGYLAGDPARAESLAGYMRQFSQ